MLYPVSMSKEEYLIIARFAFPKNTLYFHSDILWESNPYAKATHICNFDIKAPSRRHIYLIDLNVIKKRVIHKMPLWS